MSRSSPTSRDRLAALSDTARARWLDPAEAEFAAHGFENASLNRILAGAGESKGRTYHYFADKGELFRATLERRLAAIGPLELDPGAILVAGREGYWPHVAALCARLTGALQHDLRLAALVRTLHQEAAAQRAFAEPLGTLRTRIEALLAAGQGLGAVRGDLPLALMADVTLSLVATVDRWFALNADALPEAEEAALSRRAFTLLMAPLLPPDRSGDPAP